MTDCLIGFHLVKNNCKHRETRDKRQKTRIEAVSETETKTDTDADADFGADIGKQKQMVRSIDQRVNASAAETSLLYKYIQSLSCDLYVYLNTPCQHQKQYQSISNHFGNELICLVFAHTNTHTHHPMSHPATIAAKHVFKTVRAMEWQRGIHSKDCQL